MVSMPSATFTIRDYTEHAALRADLLRDGFAVAELYKRDDPIMKQYRKGLDATLQGIREDGGTPHGANRMGGTCKIYGAGCTEGAANARLDPRAKEVHSGMYGVTDVISGWDAVALLGKDAHRDEKNQPKKLPDDPQKAYYKLTGGTLQPHIDLDPGNPRSLGNVAEAKMKEVHPEFPHCVQSQLVCRSVCRGGATLVVAPGEHLHTDPTHFYGGKGDFATCTPAGFAHFHGKWRAVDQVPRGCLILWLSKLPHGNKRADVGVDPQRRAVYIAWQARALVPEEKRAGLKRKKLDAVYSGGTTDHWATHVPKVSRGSHYSNWPDREHVSKVLFTEHNPPEYPEELQARIDAAF